MADANFTEAVSLCEIGNLIHRVGRDIPRRLSRVLQRHIDDSITGLLVRDGIDLEPARECRFLFALRRELGIDVFERLVVRVREVGFDSVDLFLRYFER